VAAPVLSRPAESRAIADFLTSASVEPVALVVEGEPGIGKTTVWLAAVESAVDDGFEVLSARPASAESVLAYAALADMLVDVKPDAWAGLPAPQQLALDKVMLRAGDDELPADPRAVAAGFLSLVNHLAQETPVLLAIDDLQWLDASSIQAVAFAARRLSGRVGILGTVRTQPDNKDDASWLQLSRPDRMHRISLGPLSLGGLREIVSERLGRSLSRPTMVRVHEVSRGNPFYALELARVIDDRPENSELELPGSLAELVRARICGLTADVQDALLAVSCLAAPTVELVAQATGTDAERVVHLLADAEDQGIAEIDGHRVSFTHPLLARGVYTAAPAAQRRAMHKNLAEAVKEPELQARHLAMAVAWGDPDTLDCLDRGAQMARQRGAPAAAAELLDLAVGLGGDSAERRIRLAGNHFEAGDAARARGLLEEIVADLEPGQLRAVAMSLLGSVRAFNDSFTEGVELWQRSVADAADNLVLRVPTLVILALTQFSTGRLTEGVPTADQAVADATRLGDPLLLSQALGVRALIRFLRGDGIDEAQVQQALELEKRPSSAASAPGLQLVLGPSLQRGLLLGWSGEFERAHRELQAVRRLCDEHGHEFEWMYVAYYSAQIEIWWGNFIEAAAITEEAMTRAEQTGGDIVTGAALTMRAALAAYNGTEEQARRHATSAITMHQRCGARMLAEWPITLLGFLEVSLGHYEAALTALQPVLSRYAERRFGTELHVAAFMPEAVEAMVQLGRLDEAEPLVDVLESSGRRLDRAWMLAVGGRCRAMLLAAGGAVDAATECAQVALVEHDRLPMPFERARTQLLLGQLQRRQRRKDAATTTLSEALTVFEAMGIPLWADRARAELERTNVGHRRSGELTISEQRVAELAASGMTNRDVAAALFISPKTVEANLARIYRKLGIHSRAELGRVVGQPEP
jgi:DNA-binding CsgD family transcriptional regulator